MLQDTAAAAAAYDRALALAPADSRLLYERDQLAKRCGTPPAQRLAALEAHPELVAQRDALAAEACALYCQEGRPEAAKALLVGRKWQPWEGGEGEALAQHVRCHLSLVSEVLSRWGAQGLCLVCLVVYSWVSCTAQQRWCVPVEQLEQPSNDFPRFGKPRRAVPLWWLGGLKKQCSCAKPRWRALPTWGRRNTCWLTIQMCGMRWAAHWQRKGGR